MTGFGVIESRIRRLDRRVLDALVALGLFAALVGSEVSRGHFYVLALLGGVAIAGSVASRRRVPVVAALVTLLGVTAISRSGSGNLLVSPVAVALTYYMVGRRSADRGWSWVDAALLVLPVPMIATDPGTPSPGNPLILDVLSVWAFFLLIPFAAGRAVGTRTNVNEALRTNAERLEHEQRERARAAVLRERTRIARELHDVVAHSVSVMVIQTAAARRVAGHDPAAAADALRSVESCGRDALVDMRRMVGVLYRGDIDILGGAAPGVAQLEKLAGRAQASGLPVAMTVEGDVRALSAGLDLVVFRVVQESLTNAIKHAGPASVRVRVTFSADLLEVEVADTGNGSRSRKSAAEAPVGHGLVGMQERLALYGGQLRAGRGGDGGFCVLARVPLTDLVLA